MAKVSSADAERRALAILYWMAALGDDEEPTKHDLARRYGAKQFTTVRDQLIQILGLYWPAEDERLVDSAFVRAIFLRRKEIPAYLRGRRRNPGDCWWRPIPEEN